MSKEKLLLYHGTEYYRGRVIAEIDGPPKGLYLAESWERAEQYAKARTAVLGKDRAAILTIEVKKDEIIPDPYNPEGEPGQWILIQRLPRSRVKKFEVISMPKDPKELLFLKCYGLWM